MLNCTPAVVLYAFQQSDWFARVVVFVLLSVSMYAWTLIVDKFRGVRRIARADRRFRNAFERRRGITDLAVGGEAPASPLREVYHGAMEEIREILGVGEETFETYCRRRDLSRGLTLLEIERVREAMDRVIATQIFHLQRDLGALGTITSVSPFLGLLGTVWGVMAAFTEMARAGRPDIGAMAPGISGALLTTVIGLLVAIPCVVAYNTLAGRVKTITADMDHLADEVIDDLRREMR